MVNKHKVFKGDENYLGMFIIGKSSMSGSTDLIFNSMWVCFINCFYFSNINIVFVLLCRTITRFQINYGESTVLHLKARYTLRAERRILQVKRAIISRPHLSYVKSISGRLGWLSFFLGTYRAKG